MKSLSSPDQQVAGPEVVSPPATQTETDASNQAANDALREQGGGASGLENYQQALGQWLGTELYEAVADHVSQEAVQGYAEDLVGSILSGLGDLASDNLDGTATDKQVENFMAAIEARIGPLASEFVADHGQGLVHALQGWVNANPEIVAATAVLAAAGAVLADMDVPTLKKKLSITDELSAEVSAKLGSLRDIGLEQVKTSLQYQSGPLLAAVEGTYGEEEGFGGSGRLRYGDNQDYLEGFGSYSQESDVANFGMRGLTSFDNGLSLSGFAQGDSNGGWQAGGGAEYSSERVKAELDAVFGSSGSTISGSGQALMGEEGDWQAGGDFQLRNESLLDVGLYAGFRDRDEFRTYLGRYAFDSGTDKHSFGIMVEEKLGPIYGRLEHSTSWSATGTSMQTSAQGAYFLDDDMAIIGGLRHDLDEQGEHSFTPGIGMQLDRNALMLEYDQRNEAVMLNFTIPFGR